MSYLLASFVTGSQLPLMVYTLLNNLLIQIDDRKDHVKTWPFYFS